MIAPGGEDPDAHAEGQLGSLPWHQMHVIADGPQRHQCWISEVPMLIGVTQAWSRGAPLPQSWTGACVVAAEAGLRLQAQLPSH